MFSAGSPDRVFKDSLSRNSFSGLQKLRSPSRQSTKERHRRFRAGLARRSPLDRATAFCIVMSTADDSINSSGDGFHAVARLILDYVNPAPDGVPLTGRRISLQQIGGGVVRFEGVRQLMFHSPL